MLMKLFPDGINASSIGRIIRINASHTDSSLDKKIIKLKIINNKVSTSLLQSSSYTHPYSPSSQGWEGMHGLVQHLGYIA